MIRLQLSPGVRHTTHTKMLLTTAAIESMGFEPIPAGEVIEAQFHSLHVFETRGLIVQEADIIVMKASIDGTGYSIGIGRSVNAICKAVLVDCNS